MEKELDPFQFVLARDLHMTLEQLSEMSRIEYIGWCAFYTYEKAMRDLASKERE